MRTLKNLKNKRKETKGKCESKRSCWCTNFYSI